MDDYDNFPIWSPSGDLIAFVRKVDNDCDGERILFATTRMGFKDEALYTLARSPMEICL
jgi:hypothetical protein